MNQDDTFIVKVITTVVIVIILIILAFGSFGTVEAGSKGVETRFGAVVAELPAGLYWKIPFIEEVHQVSIQTQKVSQEADAASADLQTVSTTVAVNFNVDPTKVTSLYQNIGADYQNTVIDPAIQEAVKSTTAKYTAEQLITERTQVQEDIHTALTNALSSDNIIVSAISITNFNFSDSFNAAIEAKVTAQQNALASQNKYQQTIYDASSTVAAAQAQAESIKIQAEAINSEGGADYVELQAVNKWNGVLPTQMVPGSAVPFVNVGAATK